MGGKVIVVFGGAGFIGSHLLRKLSSNSELHLFCVDTRPPKFPTDGVTYLRADVRDLTAFDLGCRIDAIFNLAAVHVTPGHAPHEYYETNVKGATEITAFARRKRIQSIVFISSIAVYGPGDEVKTEKTEPAPQSAYGWSKLLAEGIHRSWLGEVPNRRLVICRPAAVFGWREGGNFTRLAMLLKSGVFVYPGRKDTVKACIYVDDMIEALIYAYSLEERFVLFNACYSDGHTLEQIIETFREKHFPRAKVFLLPKPFVMLAARLMAPLFSLGLGANPDRILKLVQSTDVRPNWLEEQGVAVKAKLARSLESWSHESNGQFF